MIDWDGCIKQAALKEVIHLLLKTRNRSCWVRKKWIKSLNKAILLKRYIFIHSFLYNLIIGFKLTSYFISVAKCRANIQTKSVYCLWNDS